MAGRAGPWPVVVEGFAALAVGAGGVVSTLAVLHAVATHQAARRVPVTLTPASDGEVRQRVVLRHVGGQLARLGAAARVDLVAEPAKAVERHLDVGGGDPVLQDGAAVELVRRRPALEGAEGDARRARPPASRRVTEHLGAQRLLLVALRDQPLRPPTVHLLALARVELKRRPGAAEVDALVDRHRVRARRAELQTDVGEFVPLAEAEDQRLVGDGVGALRQRRRQPARQVIGVVEVGEVGDGVAPLRVARVAHVAGAAGRPTRQVGRRLAVARRRLAARAGRGDLFAERDVDEVGDTAARRAVLVVTRVVHALLHGEHVEE